MPLVRPGSLSEGSRGSQWATHQAVVVDQGQEQGVHVAPALLVLSGLASSVALLGLFPIPERVVSLDREDNLGKN